MLGSVDRVPHTPIIIPLFWGIILFIYQTCPAFREYAFLAHDLVIPLYMLQAHDADMP